MIDLKAQSILQPFLSENERLTWAAMIDPRAYARATVGRWFYAFALLVTGLVLAATAAAMWTELGPPLRLKPFVSFTVSVLAAAGIVGAVHQARVIRAGSGGAYGVTTRRVIVATAGRKRLRAWVPVSRILGVQSLSDDEGGSVLIAAAPDAARAAKLCLTLHAVKRPNDVEALLLDLLTPRN